MSIRSCVESRRATRVSSDLWRFGGANEPRQVLALPIGRDNTPSQSPRSPRAGTVPTTGGHAPGVEEEAGNGDDDEGAVAVDGAGPVSSSAGDAPSDTAVGVRLWVELFDVNSVTLDVSLAGTGCVDVDDLVRGRVVGGELGSSCRTGTHRGTTCLTSRPASTRRCNCETCMIVHASPVQIVGAGTTRRRRVECVLTPTWAQSYRPDRRPAVVRLTLQRCEWQADGADPYSGCVLPTMPPTAAATMIQVRRCRGALLWAVLFTHKRVGFACCCLVGRRYCPFLCAVCYVHAVHLAARLWRAVRVDGGRTDGSWVRG